MRLGIAAAALAFRQTAGLSTSSSLGWEGDKDENNRNAQVASAAFQRFRNNAANNDRIEGRHLHEPSNQSHLRRIQQHRKTKRRKRDLVKNIDAKSEMKLATATATLMNDNIQQHQQQTVIECDPHTLDMGILQCGGNGNYCIESQISSTGGICSNTDASVPAHRNLQSPPCSQYLQCTEVGVFCNYALDGSEGLCVSCPCGDNPSYGCSQLDLAYALGIYSCINSCTPNPNPYRCQEYEVGDVEDPNYSCESNIDPITGYGFEACTGVSEYCFDSDSSCCYSYTFNTTNGPDGYFSVTYTFYATEPYSQNVTVSYNSIGTDCGIIFNGEDCDICQTSPNLMYPGEYCLSFDCTNNAPGMAGSLCDYESGEGIYALIPILSQCYYGLPPPPPPTQPTGACNICGNNGYPTYPEYAFPGGYTCQDVWSYTNSSTLAGTEQCTVATNYFGGICCDGITPCNICGDRSLSNPTGLVYVPIIGYIYCDELYEGGFQGSIESCPTVSEIARPTCCQIKEEDLICIVCPNDVPVSFPDRVIDSSPGIPPLPDLTCGVLQQFGRDGVIPPQGCGAAREAVLEVCGCGTDPTCLVCPNDEQVTNPDLVIETPDGLSGDRDLTCRQLQDFGRQGLIPRDLCEDAQVAIPALCGCGLEDEQSSEIPAGETTSDPPTISPESEMPSMILPPDDESDMPGDFEIDTEPPGESEVPAVMDTEPPVESPMPSGSSVEDMPSFVTASPETDPPDIVSDPQGPTESPTEVESGSSNYPIFSWALGFSFLSLVAYCTCT